MKLINYLSEISIDAYILYKSEEFNVNRVYKVLEMNSNGISKREFIYGSDKRNHANSFISSSTFRNRNVSWFLLDEKEIQHYLKLAVFE